MLTNKPTPSTGFASYLTSNLAFYYSPLIRSQYAARHPGLTPTVQFNDITFAFHALLISLITTSQYLFRPLWSFAPATGTRPSRFILGVSAGCVVGVAIVWLIAGATPGNDPASDWCELDVVYAIGYVKVIITFIKYTPQILANWRNQSTQGWSISQILLDFAGGILSIAQLFIDSYLQRDWSGITGNPIKLALGNASMFYDSVFMTQHFVLYRHDGQKAGSMPGSSETDRLLADEERRHID